MKRPAAAPRRQPRRVVTDDDDSTLSSLLLTENAQHLHPQRKQQHEGHQHNTSSGKGCSMVAAAEVQGQGRGRRSSTRSRPPESSENVRKTGYPKRSVVVRRGQDLQSLNPTHEELENSLQKVGASERAPFDESASAAGTAAFAAGRQLSEEEVALLVAAAATQNAQDSQAQANQVDQCAQECNHYGDDNQRQSSSTYDGYGYNKHGQQWSQNDYYYDNYDEQWQIPQTCDSCDHWWYSPAPQWPQGSDSHADDQVWWQGCNVGAGYDKNCQSSDANAGPESRTESQKPKIRPTMAPELEPSNRRSTDVELQKLNRRLQCLMEDESD
jgi:hypothetical protein